MLEPALIGKKRCMHEYTYYIICIHRLHAEVTMHASYLLSCVIIILIEQLVLFVQTTAIYRIEYVGILGVPGLDTINVHEYLCMFNSACMCRMEPLHWW